MNGASPPPSAGDSEASIAANQMPSCDGDGCESAPGYLTRDGAYCEFCAWTHGVARSAAGGISTTGGGC